MEEKSWTDKLVDFVFSKSTVKYVLLIAILGAILRFVIAKNIGFLGDEMVHGPHAIGILNKFVLSRMTQSIVWFYLTDIAHKILGVTAISTRFLSIFFGILIIPIVYLLGKEFYNKKVGLTAAFLLSISAFTLRYTLIEMDITAIFFVLVAMLFFIKKAKQGKFSYLAALFLGIGSLVKSSAFFFIPAFLIWFYVIQEKPRKKVFSKSKKSLIVFLIIAALMYTPILAHNYLLYKDKGIVDVYFSKYFNINREVYAYQAGVDVPFVLKDIFVGGPKMLFDIIKMDPLIMLLGIFGIFLMFRKKDRANKSLLFLSTIIPFLVLSISVLLQTHFVIIMPFMAIFAASSIEELTKKFSNKKILYLILLAIFIINLYLILPHLTSQSAIIKTRNYAKEIPNDALVVVDGRFYTGRTVWMFYDKIYLESNYLGGFLTDLDSSTSQKVPIDLYFVECLTDDCGWGTIKDQPELNQTMEDLASFLKQDAVLVKTFNGGGGYVEKTGEPTVAIYNRKILLQPEIFLLAKQTHYWWGYSVNYEKESYDSYNVYGLFDNLIKLLASVILILAIILAALSPLLLIPFWKKYT